MIFVNDYYSLILIVGVLFCGDSFSAQDVALKASGERMVSKLVVTHMYSFDLLLKNGDLPTPVFSSDGKLLAYRDQKGISIIEALSGKVRNRVDSDIQKHLLAFSSDNRFLTMHYGGRINQLAVGTGREERLAEFKSRFIAILPFTGRFLVLDDGVIQVRDVKSGDLESAFQVQRRKVGVNNSVGIGKSAISSDEKELAVKVQGRNGVKIWRIETGKQSVELKDQSKQIEDICFSKSGKWFASTGVDKTVRIWDAKTGDLLQNISIPGFGLRVAFSPEEKWLAVGWVAERKSYISVFDSATGQMHTSWETKMDNPFCLAFNPRGMYLLSSGSHVLQVWELTAKKAITK